MKAKVKVFGGLPLICEFEVQPRDSSVGIFHPYVEGMCLEDRNGRVALWAERKMKEKDWDSVEEQCMEHYDAVIAEEDARHAAAEDAYDNFRYEQRRDARLGL